MIDIKKLFPLIKQALPNVQDDLLLKKMKEFAADNPDMSNIDALMAFNEAMKHPDMQKFVAGNKNKFSAIEGRLDQKEVK
jgi:hypothetical protein